MLEVSQGHSAAFRGRDIPDPMATIAESEATPISNQQKLSIAATSGSTYFELFLRCSEVCGQIWMEIPAADQQTIIRLPLYHPLFEQMDWVAIPENGFYLYQKSPVARNISDFLAQKNNNNFLADALFEYAINQPLPPSQQLSQTWDLPPVVDTIITNIPPIRTNQEWYYLSRQIPTDQAYVEDQTINLTLNHLPHPDFPDSKLEIARFQHQSN